MVKKRLFILAAACICLLLTGCGSDFAERADDAALRFTEAMLARDDAALEPLVHPEHKEEVRFDDGFYEVLAELEILPGMKLQGLDAGEKRFTESDDALEGTVYVCGYVAQIDQMFYDISLVFLDNDAGFGIVAASAGYCTDPSYY